MVKSHLWLIPFIIPGSSATHFLLFSGYLGSIDSIEVHILSRILPLALTLIKHDYKALSERDIFRWC